VLFLLSCYFHVHVSLPYFTCINNLVYLISIVPRPASQQCIRDGHLERQAFRANLCGGESEYLHRSPTSHKRWRSLIWDSKIWSWVLRDFDPRMTALARPRSNYMSKLQTHPIIREDGLHQETREVTQKTKIWTWAPYGSPTPRETGRLTVGHKLTAARNSVDSTTTACMRSKERPVFMEEQGVPGSLLAPANSESIHTMAAHTIWPTIESSESLNASRLGERLPDSRGRSYFRSAIFIAASPGNLHCGHVAGIRRSSQRQRGRTLITLQDGPQKHSVSDSTVVFHVAICIATIIRY
jgi:hypothetical protein